MSKSTWVLRRDVPYGSESDEIFCIGTSATYGRCCLCKEAIEKDSQVCDKSYQDVIVTSYEEALERLLNNGYHVEAVSSTSVVYCDN